MVFTTIYIVFTLCCCLAAKLCPTLCDPMDCSPPGSSIHGILQARILEWVAFPSPGIFPTQGPLSGRLYHWATWEARIYIVLDVIMLVWFKVYRSIGYMRRLCHFIQGTQAPMDLVWEPGERCLGINPPWIGRDDYLLILFSETYLSQSFDSKNCSIPSPSC